MIKKNPARLKTAGRFFNQFDEYKNISYYVFMVKKCQIMNIHTDAGNTSPVLFAVREIGTYIQPWRFNTIS
ncbi:MAG: hypothetical protein NT098_06045 [Candidatus Parcubacteria bacterium]|nr:hypothetical protein [Candidatus Parcubacteria bacterium]